VGLTKCGDRPAVSAAAQAEHDGRDHERRSLMVGAPVRTAQPI